MSYIKIIGSDTKYYVDIMPFTTQHGHNAIRFIGEEIPETNTGFMLYNDNDEIIASYATYTHLYRPNEYSVAEDEIVYPQWTNAPIQPSSIDILNKRINKLSNRVDDITPYEETKKAYYGEIETTFYNVPQGNVSIFFSNYKGDYDVNRISDRIVVTFSNRLEESTEITIMINK